MSALRRSLQAGEMGIASRSCPSFLSLRAGRQSPHDRGDILPCFADRGNALGALDPSRPGVIGGQRLFKIAAEPVELFAQVTCAPPPLGERNTRVDHPLATGPPHQL